MVQTEERPRKIKGYCCSNPNCKSVFSQPKIIKYYVCPSCQSVVEMEGVHSQPLIEEPTNEKIFCLFEDYRSLEAQQEDPVNPL